MGAMDERWQTHLYQDWEASSATTCEWIVDAWVGGIFDGEISQLFNSDTEDEDLDGFVTEE